MRQRTDLINALRAHLYEYGYVVPQGTGHLGRVEEILDEPNSELPELVRELGRVLLGEIGGKADAALDHTLRQSEASCNPGGNHRECLGIESLCGGRTIA